MKTYSGKEWKEKWKKDPELKGIRMREEPADWETVDEHGTPVSPGGKGYVLLFVFVLLTLVVLKGLGLL